MPSFCRVYEFLRISEFLPYNEVKIKYKLIMFNLVEYLEGWVSFVDER